MRGEGVELSEDSKVRIIDLVFSQEEIAQLNKDGIIEPGKVWINKGYGYRQQLLVEAGEKLIRVAGKTDFWDADKLATSPSPRRKERRRNMKAKDTVLRSDAPGYFGSISELLLKQAEATWLVAFEAGCDEEKSKVSPEPIKPDEELLRRTIREILAQPAYTTIDEEVSLVWNVLKEYGFVRVWGISSPTEE